MKPETRRALVKEGLIFLVNVLGIISLIFEKYYTNLALKLRNLYNPDSPRYMDEYTTEAVKTYSQNAIWFHNIGIFLIFVYGAYLFISLFTRAIKTPREQ